MSSRGGGDGAMTGRESSWRILSVLGGLVGYGCLAASLSLVGLQIYGWFKEGEWTHISLGDGIRAVLERMHVPDDATGRLAGLSHWLDAPVNWLGLHKVVRCCRRRWRCSRSPLWGTFCSSTAPIDCVMSGGGADARSLGGAIAGPGHEEAERDE